MRGRRLTIGLLAGLVVVIVLGTGGAVAISRHQRDTSSQNSASPTTEATEPTTGAQLASSAVGPDPVPGAPARSSSGDPTIPPSGPSNNMTVQMSPSVQAHSRAGEVQQLMQGFFDAINQRDYSSWSQLVSSSMARSQSVQQWLEAYATTADSSIWLQSMQDDPMQVTVHFTSTQDVDLAPKDLPVGCIDWTLTYQIESEHGRLVVGPTVPDSLEKHECP